MSPFFRRVWLLSFCFLHLCLAQKPLAKVLIYSATKEFRHDSIPVASQALQDAGTVANIQFVHTENRADFNDANLATFDALLFLHNTGEVLDDAGKAAFQRYLDKGGNFVGVHSASDCLRNTPSFKAELGAAFDYHANLQSANFLVVDSNHPSTSKLPARWPLLDEIYNFKSDPRLFGARIVLSVDESSYTDDHGRQFDQGLPHPIAWFQEHGAGTKGGSAGRSFYTALGHAIETWKDPVFMSHIMGGVQWVLASNTTRAFNANGSVGNTGSSSGNATSLTPDSSETKKYRTAPPPLKHGFIKRLTRNF